MWAAYTVANDGVSPWLTTSRKSYVGNDDITPITSASLVNGGRKLRQSQLRTNVVANRSALFRRGDEAEYQLQRLSVESESVWHKLVRDYCNPRLCNVLDCSTCLTELSKGPHGRHCEVDYVIKIEAKTDVTMQCISISSFSWRFTSEIVFVCIIHRSFIIFNGGTNAKFDWLGLRKRQLACNHSRAQWHRR